GYKDNRPLFDKKQRLSLLEVEKLFNFICPFDNYWNRRYLLVSYIFVTLFSANVSSFYEEPQLKDDMLTAFTKSAYLLVCFSEGYFIYDMLEMMKFGCKGSYEIIAHHIMIVSCFTITVFQHKYLGYCCTALTIELHNIFLHFRQLLNIANVPRDSTLYRLNRIVNIGK
ncbi:TLC domain-containing protein 2-like protein, partial [Leptotrombidium deliense]